MPSSLKNLFLVLIPALLAVPAWGDALDDIGKRGTVNLGFRTDAAPFSFLDDTNRAAGFSVDLCKQIVDDIGKTLGKPVVAKFVPVATSDRFSALEDGTIDLLCGATTVTLERREHADFTLFTFVTGGTFMTRAGANEIDLHSGKPPRVGVLANTTSEAILRKVVASGNVKMDVVPVDTHDIAIGFLMSNVLDGYFGDQALLWDRRARASDPSALVVSTTLLTLEPYALAMKRGEDRLRLVSDRTLATTYRSGDIYRLIERWFPNGKPTPLLQALYAVQGIAEE